MCMMLDVDYAKEFVRNPFVSRSSFFGTITKKLTQAKVSYPSEIAQIPMCPWLRNVPSFHVYYDLI